MARIRFHTDLERHVTATDRDYDGGTVRAMFDEFFREWPQLRWVILDDRGALRSHLQVFVDGQPLSDLEHLSDPVSACGFVYVSPK